MSAVKNEMDNVCRGCLAIDRTLRPLIKNVDLFFIFLGNELSISDESKYYNILLCWECIALLKKAQAFRTRVQTAHRYFERILSSPTIRALTNLRVYKKDDYDLIHIEDENAPKIKPEELKFEVSLQVTAADCHIKEETNYDEDNHFDYEPEDESKPDISSLVKKEKKKKKYKVSPLGKRIKTKTVKYKPEDIDQYIEEREYTLKEVLAMRDERKPSRLRIRNMETRCNVYIAKLLDSQKIDLAKKTTSGGLSCSECDAVVPDQESMKSHWELHPVSLLRCHFCGLLSRSRKYLAYHVESRHSVIYRCTVCHVEYRNITEYYRHDRELHKTMLCDYCGKKFNQKSGIERHIKRKHLPLKCDVCKRPYKKMAFLNNHMAVCHPDVKWRSVKRELTYCVECDMHFATEFLYKRHLRTAVVHRPRPKISLKHLPLKCDVCKRPYKQIAFLNNHMAVCHPDVKWRSVKRELTYCVECDMHFATEFLYKRHLRTAVVHRPRPKISRYHLPIQCQICKKVYKREGTLDNHMAVRHPEVKWKAVKRELTYCVECDIHFATEDLFKRHLRHYVRHRTKPRKEQYNHLPAKCYICNYEFKRKHYLTEHMKLRHMDVAKTKANIGKELAYCVECDLQFASEYFYKRHLRYAVAHKRRIRPKVPCPDCGKIFSRKSYMDNHYKLVHVRKSQHYCELCDKHFINGYAIRTHKKFVHDKYEKPKNKICDICGRGFHTNRVLINHKRTHTGERPHKCSYCPAAFAQNVARKTHEKTQHKHLLHELKGFT